MTEDEARAWFDRSFGIPARQRVGAFLDMVAAENEHQNLISPATLPQIWARHAVDSAQLLTHAPAAWNSWIDVGTGGGFPGMVIALLVPDKSVMLVEPRRKRTGFLQGCIARFELAHATVVDGKVENNEGKGDVITARAVASLDTLIRSAGHCATKSTTWLLPRGSSGQAELDMLPLAVRRLFHVEHSLTNPSSVILVGRGVLR